jgi:hypothetical protein
LVSAELAAGPDEMGDVEDELIRKLVKGASAFWIPITGFGAGVSVVST